MGKAKKSIIAAAVFVLLFSPEYLFIQGGSTFGQTKSTSVQTKPKSATTATKTDQAKKKTLPTSTKPAQKKPVSTQAASKSVPSKSKPVKSVPKPSSADKINDASTIRIGTQGWAIANLNVNTFRNGDTIPEARTNEEWIAAGESGKPAWCYYNNDPKYGLKYGKLYNWHAVNDPRGLAPAGWSLPGDADWIKLANSLGGQSAAGNKMKSNSGWSDDYNGTNESGFAAFPAGYRAENGAFLKIGSVGTWWSSTENKGMSAIDYYISRDGSINRSISPRHLGESVRCIRK